MTHETPNRSAWPISHWFTDWFLRTFNERAGCSARLPALVVTGACLMGVGCSATGPKSADNVTESYGIPKYDSYADRPASKTVGPQLNLAYGQLQEQRGQFTEARESYKKVLKENPKSVEAMAGIGRLDLAAGRVLDAERQFKDALKANPNSAVALAQLGQFYVEQGRNSEGIAMLTQAMSAAPDEKTYRYNLAVALTRSGLVEQAMPHFALSVGEAQGHYNVGVILHEQGDTAGCEREMRLALGKNPDLEEARAWLVDLGAEASGDNLSLMGNQRPASPAARRPAAKESPKPVIRVHSATMSQQPATQPSASTVPQGRQQGTGRPAKMHTLTNRGDENLPANGPQISPSQMTSFRPLNAAAPQQWKGSAGEQWQPLPTATATNLQSGTPAEPLQNQQGSADSDFSTQPDAPTTMPRWDQRASSSSFN